jgi:outer membrane biogenesis lipoprotein LolB/tetratricopeptide (TPR) repeat protein
MTIKPKFLLSILLASASLQVWSAPAKSLTEEQMFQILASEISLQRGEASAAYQTYMSMARSLRDGPLAQRAMEIAIAGNSPELALDAARLWDEINPKDAKEILTTLFMLNQRWSESVKPAQAQLSQLKSIAAKEKLINSWRPLLARAQDEDASLIAFFNILQASIPLINDLDILYTYSLGAEKVKNYEAMEQTLRRIIQKKPDDKNALNALGYSFADRGIRLVEAVSLLKKAHQLAPNDMYILDSLGWANFRLGNTSLAIEQLTKAFETKPEAEIGAHLGEALWTTQDRKGADLVWRKAESLDANNKTLKDTMARLWPDRVPSSSKKSPQLWDGRFAVKVSGKDSKNGGSGAFTLSHEAQTDILDIRSPMGGAMAKITINASGAKLEDGDKIFEAHDADALLQSYTGLPLPARGLSKWLNGEARVGAPASIERDDKLRAQKIIQDGWTMSFQWTEKNQIKKLDLTRKSPTGLIEIKIIFEELDD